MKSGIELAEVCTLYSHIMNECNQLQVEGLMTIGKYGHDYTTGPNLDFVHLMKCHETVCNTLKLSPEKVHISMGMSNDFDHAVSVKFL